MDKLLYFVRMTDAALERSLDSFTDLAFFEEDTYGLDDDDDDIYEAEDDNNNNHDDVTDDDDALYDDDDDEDELEFDENFGEDDEDSAVGATLMTATIGNEIVSLWKKRRTKLVSDYAIAAWMLSPIDEIRLQVSEHHNGSDCLTVERVLTKLYSGDDVDMGTLVDQFWVEWEMFHSKTGESYGRKFIWNSQLLRCDGKSHKWKTHLPL